MSIDRKKLKPYSTQGKAAAPALSGQWENELGSVMNIASFDGTNFSGTYTSAVSGGSGSTTGTLAGTVNGDAIGFTVNWAPNYSAVTSWNGLVLSDGGSLVLYTLWHLASTPPQESDFWESIQAGADLFFQQ